MHTHTIPAALDAKLAAAMVPAFGWEPSASSWAGRKTCNITLYTKSIR